MVADGVRNWVVEASPMTSRIWVEEVQLKLASPINSLTRSRKVPIVSEEAVERLEFPSKFSGFGV